MSSVNQVDNDLYRRVRSCLPERFKEKASAQHKQLMPSDSVLVKRVRKLGVQAGRRAIEHTMDLAAQKALYMHDLHTDLQRCLDLLLHDDGTDARTRRLRIEIERASAHAARTARLLSDFVQRNQSAVMDGVFEEAALRKHNHYGAARKGSPDVLPGVARQMRFITHPSHIRIGPQCGVSVRSFTTGKWAPLPASRMYRVQGAARSKLNQCFRRRGLPLLVETKSLRHMLAAVDE